jgi:hypothetical protein
VACWVGQHLLPMSSGREKVGAATMAPVGSKISIFSKKRLRMTTSSQRPLYLQPWIHRVQNSWVSICSWSTILVSISRGSLSSASASRRIKDTAWPSHKRKLAATASPSSDPGTLTKLSFGHVRSVIPSSSSSPQSMVALSCKERFFDENTTFCWHPCSLASKICVVCLSCA